MKLYPWQEVAGEKLLDKDSILTAPTNTGKTMAACIWSNIYDTQKNVFINPLNRVIFTAPIKALSNERYLDLKGKGLDVGLETGDLCKNINARILCCTQEIYTNKYAYMPNQKVIIDEMHYMFNNPDRTRAYIDGIMKTSLDSRLLVMSATFGNPCFMQRYLQEITGRRFVLFRHNKRITPLIFTNIAADYQTIRDSLVFVFSQHGVNEIAERIAIYRKSNFNTQRDLIEEIAQIVGISKIKPCVNAGVGYYYGALLPKEKLFMESLFRNRLIDTMVGTDSLALGINLPVSRVVFAQLAKYYDGPISKNEFMQMAGRAGRTGYFDKGFVQYMDSPYEAHGYDTRQLFISMQTNPYESAVIKLEPSISLILKGVRRINEEAAYVARSSYPKVTREWVKISIENDLRLIKSYSELAVDPEYRNRFIQIVSDIYEPELSCKQNLAVARILTIDKQMNAEKYFEITSSEQNNSFAALLQSKKMISRLMPRYKVTGLGYLDREIQRIDNTVYSFEEKLDEIKLCLSGKQHKKAV